MIRFHSHAKERLFERGVSEKEVLDTVEKGESFPVKFGRTGFRRNFLYNSMWRGKYYSTKQVEVYAVQETDDWLVILK